ncbi:hypothetical protein H257_05911 [Aphanomyces astaci]|uniref:Uncharacterized protein n=1 Tax=Aphanomyces astaci TaxID=112090 RepID=W4GQS6_APHAT|nr:hypothetical protein H257_05911 [Aphanomyces astaci]ETV81374.1 hypothetical protein H257_05911 [Aphanomyces astaci]|eukprot:XP_009829232.1 hypothetical protein H257_05911 [Aphanomyces astaci]
MPTTTIKSTTASHAIAYHKLEIQHSKEDVAELKRLIETATVTLDERRQRYEALTAEAAHRRAKMAQLVQDELAVRKQQDEAIKSRFKLQRRLSDVGGHENALKMLIATLAATKNDVQNVRQSKATLSAAHKDMEKEIASLTAAVQKAKATIETLNRDRQALEAKKLDVDGKLAKIAAFLTSP